MPVVSAVCQTWRTVAFNTPELWTKMCVCAFADHEEREIRVQAAGDRGLQLAFVAHSHGLAEALEDAIRHVDKTSTLDITIDEENIEAQELYPSEVIEDYIRVLEGIDYLTSRKLARFALFWNVGGMDDDLAPAIHLSILDSPNLTWLHIDGVRLFYEHRHTLRFDMLTVLCLGRLRTISSITTNDIVNLCGRCPSLRCLSLDHALNSPGQPDEPRDLPHLQIVLIRDDVAKIAGFLRLVSCPVVEYVRIWAIARHDETGIHIGRSTASIMRSPLITTVSSRQQARSLAIAHSDCDHFSVGCSNTSGEPTAPWDGLSYGDIRPTSIYDERDRLLRRAANYNYIIHILTDHLPGLVTNPGILCAEHVIRQFVVSHRNPTILDTFCARGMSYALAEYMSGIDAASIIIEQAKYPLHNWLAALPHDVCSRATFIHVSHAYIADDTAVALEQLSKFTDVVVDECLRGSRRAGTYKFFI